jgi:pimeloyl-ACP methyl ester carboxylesterase
LTELTVPQPHQIVDLTMADGAVIRLRRHGNPDGPRLVLAHGNGFAIDAYFPFWRLLTDRFDLVIYDQRNHGWNPRHDDLSRHDVDSFVSDMEEVFHGVRRELGDKAMAGVFHSISAITAIQHALEGGSHWDALALFDPPLIPAPGAELHELAYGFETGLAKWAAGRPDRFPNPEALAGGYAKSRGLRRWVDGEFLLMARSVLRENGAEGDWELCCPRECESRVYLTNSELDLCGRLGGLSGNYKFICSDPEEEGSLSPGHVNRIMYAQYGHPYEVIPGTSHLLQVEKPAECAAALLAFLEECKFIPPAI